MKTTYKFVILYMLFHTTAFCQKYDNVWMLGGGNGFAFGMKTMRISFGTNGLFQVDTCTRDMAFTETHGAISDRHGNLLFYTNGIFMADANDDTVPNSYGINPAQYTDECAPNGLHLPNAVAILPDVSDSLRYHVIHNTLEYMNWQQGRYPTRLYHSLVEYVNGQPAVTLKNQVIVSDTLDTNIWTVRHANGRDWWIAIKAPYSHELYVILLDKDGIHPPVKQNVVLSSLAAMFSHAAVSPDGKWLAGFAQNHGVWLYGFDRCSGLVVGGQTLYLPKTSAALGVGGVSFSPSSRLLYATAEDTLYQYDLSAADIASTRFTVGIYDGFMNPFPAAFTYAYLAPDNKIYIASGSSTKSMSVIHEPDKAGSACNFVQHGLSLPAYNTATIPNYTNYRLGALAGSGCDTLASVQDAPYERGVVRVYPNPSTGVLRFVLPAHAGGGTIALCDGLGQTVKLLAVPPGADRLEADCSWLPDGIYVARWVSGAQFEVCKFIIQK